MEFKLNLPWFSRYLAWAVALVFVGVSFLFKINPIILAILFCIVLTWPGFSLSRIFKLKLGDDFISQFLTWVLLGLIFILLINFFAIIIGLTLNLLLWAYLLISVLLFLLAFYLDMRHREFKPTEFTLKQLIPDFWSILIVITAVFMLTVINDKGSILKGGDALYHLSIIRKAISNEPLTIANLSYTLSNFHIAYVFPVWHIFLALLAKIARIDIFILWQNLALALSILAILVWVWLTKVIFPTRQLQAISLLFFMIFTFNWDGGYLFTTLIIPHSLSQIIILPLSIGLALHYIFKLRETKWLIILTLFLGLSLFVHLTGYFYYLCLMAVFFIGYAVSQFKDENFRQNLLRIVFATTSVLAVLIPLLILWKFLGQKAFSNTLAYFYNAPITKKIAASNISGWSIKAKYALIALPLLLPFVRKNRSFILLIGSFAMLPIIYLSFFRGLIFKTLGFVWLKRLQETILWYYLVWAIVLGFLLLLFDLLISRFNLKIQRICQVSIFILAIILAYLQIKFQTIKVIHDQLFSHALNPWINHNYLWLLAAFLLLSLLTIWLTRVKPSLNNIFVFTEPKNQLTNVILAIVIGFILLAPSFNDLVKPDFRSLTKPVKKTSSTEKSLLNYIGGPKVVAYIGQNISPRAIFDCFDCPYYLLPLVNVKKPTYTNTTNDLFYALYSAKTPIKQKLKILNKSKLEYLLISVDAKKWDGIKAQFEPNSQYFTNVFTNDPSGKEHGSLIYKVNQTQVTTDLKQNQ